MPTTIKFTGTIPPLPTFLMANGQVDQSAMRASALSMAEAGVDGLLVLGTTGEGMALNAGQRLATVSAVCRAETELPVMVGCHGQTPDDALEQLRAAAAGGATAGLVLPPYYYPHRQEALEAYYTAVADSSPIPVLLYHIPQQTRNALELDTLERLSTHSRIIGMKDSHGQPLAHFAFLNLQTESFQVLQGAAPLLLTSLVSGGAGGITPVAALYPELELGLRSALHAGDVAAAGTTMRRISRVAALLRSGGYSLISNVKAMASILGQGSIHVVAPSPEVSAQHLAFLETEMADLKAPDLSVS